MAQNSEWDEPLSGPTVPGAGTPATVRDEWSEPLVAPGPTLDSAAVPQARGFARLAMVPQALATGTQNLLGLPGALEQLGNKVLPDFMTRPLGGGEKKQIFPTGEDIAKSTGLGLENHPELRPEGALERYGVAGLEAVPNALMLITTGGMSATPAIASSLGGAAASQAAVDAHLGPAATIAAGIVGSLGAGWASSAVTERLAASAANRNFVVKQAELAAAKEALASGKENIATALDQTKTASTGRLAAAKQLADDSVAAAQSEVANTYNTVAGSLGKAQTLEQAGQTLQDQARNWFTKVMPEKLAAVSGPLDKLVPKDTPTFLNNFEGTLQSINKQAGSLQGVANLLSKSMPRSIAEELGLNVSAEAKKELGELAGTAAAAAVPKAPPTWGEVRTIRSLLGDAMQDPTLVKTIGAKNLDAMYASISKDLGAAAEKAGAGDAWQAFNQESTRLYQLAGGPMSRIISTGNAAKESITPEAAAHAALATAKKGGTELVQLRAEIPTAVDDLGAAALRGGKWEQLAPEGATALLGDPTKAQAIARAQQSAAVAETNAAQARSVAEAAHQATMEQAKRLAQQNRTQLARNARGAKAAAAEAKAALPQDKMSLTDMKNLILRGIGGGLIGNELAPWLMHQLDMTPAQLGTGALAGALVAQGASGAARAVADNPRSLLVPAAGYVAGENALAPGKAERPARR